MITKNEFNSLSPDERSAYAQRYVEAAFEMLPYLINAANHIAYALAGNNQLENNYEQLSKMAEEIDGMDIVAKLAPEDMTKAEFLTYLHGEEDDR